jgi:hypothetical protein
MAPKTGDDEFPDAPGTSTSGSAAASIWDLGGLNPKSPITLDYGNPYSRMPKQLPAEDREQAERAPQFGLPPDLLKLPVKYFAKDKAKFLGLQRAMFDGGFYGAATEGSIAFGSYTPATDAAWLKVLQATARAQESGLALTPDQIIQQSIEGRAGAAKGAPPAPLIVEHEDPKVVAGMLQQAAQSSLGRDLSDSEVEHFISEYHAAEDAYYKQRKVASEATTGRVDLTKPDLQATAQAAVSGGHGTEAASNDMADYVGALESMLGGR